MNNEKELIGTTGAVTGVDTPDPKEGDPSTIFTTTPPQDRVGAADASSFTPVEVDPGAVTAQFDALATRDPAAMEHQLQAPEYEGAQSAETLGISTVALDGAVAAAGIGVLPSAVAAGQSALGSIDPNPNYTPPSKMSPPHEAERPGNLPVGDVQER